MRDHHLTISSCYFITHTIKWNIKIKSQREWTYQSPISSKSKLFSLPHFFIAFITLSFYINQILLVENFILILRLQQPRSNARLTLCQPPPSERHPKRFLSKHLRSRFPNQFFIMPKMLWPHSKSGPFCRNRCQSAATDYRNQLMFRLRYRHPMHFWVYRS